MVVHTFHSSIQETQAGRSLSSNLIMKFQENSQCYKVTPFLRAKEVEQNRKREQKKTIKTKGKHKTKPDKSFQINALHVPSSLTGKQNFYIPVL